MHALTRINGTEQAYHQQQINMRACAKGIYVHNESHSKMAHVSAQPDNGYMGNHLYSYIRKLNTLTVVYGNVCATMYAQTCINWHPCLGVHIYCIGIYTYRQNKTFTHMLIHMYLYQAVYNHNQAMIIIIHDVGTMNEFN